MHRIPDIKTNAIKMFKQQVVCQKDNQSSSNNYNNNNNNSNTYIYENNILITNNNNVVVVDTSPSHVKTTITTTPIICNQKTKYNNSNTVILDNKAQQNPECAFLEIMHAQQTPQYVDDSQANGCDLVLEVDDGEDNLHTNVVMTHSADGAYLKKHLQHQQHSQHNDGAHCVRVTSYQRTSNFRTAAADLPSLESAKCHELEYEIDVGTVLEGEGLQFAVQTAPASSDKVRPTNASQIVECDSFEASVCLDRNARRPMNAFLIFCKRHRAIVKERYKSLENRAITKILGDWWASLDVNEKHCFTNLAQKNKDAFFNANPNFKWYKLPAPPLRPSYTRPNSGIDNVNQSRLAVINSYVDGTPLTATDTAIGTVQAMPNYFKMTESTQMCKRNDMLSNRMIKDNEQALQMALSETTEFLTNNMPNKSYYHKTNSLKTTQQSEDVCSSSDDEYSIPSTNDKSSRRCKGKIYQQLIKSGRIVASAKKMKSSPMQLQQSGHLFYNKTDISATLESKHFMSLNDHAYETSQSAITTATTTHSNTFSQFRNVDKCEVTASLPYTFDLDKKIQELPALNLDAYLQRKHNTNKKTKFNTKKQRRAAVNSVRLATTATISKTSAKDLLKQQVGKECLPELRAANAVGSRKRKARKESITRRDLSIIEQEISSIMPLTINGCYYFNECVINPLNVHTAPKTFTHNSATIDSTSSPLTLASPTLSSSSSSLSFEHLTADGGATNASDLLILAEVAANRTDFAKQ